MAELVPQSQVKLKLNQARNFTKTLRRVRRDQVTVVPLDGYETGVAQMRTKAGGELLLDFSVEIDHDTNSVTVTADGAATAEVTRSGVFDVALLHSNGVDVLLLCPPVPMELVKAVSVVPD